LNVLYLLRQEPGDTEKEIIEAHRETCTVTIVDLAVEKDYQRILSLIEDCDRVLSC